MDFEVGKLYKCSEYYILLCPTIGKAEEAVVWNTTSVARHITSIDYPINSSSDYWSELLKTKVGFSNPDEIFLVLKIENHNGFKYAHVLFGEKPAWITIPSYLNLERVL